MEKRLPLAILLSFAFMLGYSSLYMPPEGAGSDVDPASTGPGGGGDPAAVPDGPPAPLGAQPGSVTPTGSATPDAPPAAPVAQAPAREVDFEIGALQTRWSSLGGALTHLSLTDQRPSLESTDPLPLLAPMDASAGSLVLSDTAGTYGLDRIHWELVQTADQLTFEHTTPDGLRLRRTVRPVPGADHQLAVDLEVSNTSAARKGLLSFKLQAAHGLVSDGVGNRFYGQHSAVAVIEDAYDEREVETWGPGDLTDDARFVDEGEQLIAAGTTSNYFAVMLAPGPETDVRQVYPLPVLDRFGLERAVEAEQPVDEIEAQRWRDQLRAEHMTNPAAELALTVLPLEPGASRHFEFTLYAGPKSTVAAEEPNQDFLANVIDEGYGNWSWINHALLAILRFFESIFGNWGVAIILLTVLVKGLTFPLNRRQQTSMSKYTAAMQRLKPKLDELKAKYKNNTRKFQEEQMKLLKQEGVTPPLGGCLLMFLQFPIWISLFQILGTSIELRQSAFFGWIQDLSRPDQMPFGLLGFETINLLPILMAAATIVQMRSQPKPADDNQAQTQKIMGLIMPVFMLWLLYGYSAGLSLYIFTSSLIGIFEFHVIRRIWPVEGGANPGQPKPAAAA